MQDTELIREFLIESNENLSRLDQEMVDLEKRPEDAELLASVFRTVHTIKGTCGFLGFCKLERIAHQAESILGDLRNGDKKLTPELTSVLLESIDAIKNELISIESTGAESEDRPSQPVTEAVDPNFGKRQNDKEATIADSTIRVDVALLNKLMNLVGELVLARNQILQFTADSKSPGLGTTAQKLNLITTELQEQVMRTRMQPIGNVWANFPRVVRDLARTCEKQISLEMDGAETELDKTIIEAIKDPLTHIIRNACDHGIETPQVRLAARKSGQGRLTVSAFHEGGNVNIEITDDGAGIDPQQIKTCAVSKGLIAADRAERMSERELIGLVFLPGFSTARQVSSISGRGVGMDVVKTNIEKIGGTVDLVSRLAQGTTVRIRIPLTLAIVPGLVVTSGGERFIIPQISLLELIRIDASKAKSQIERIDGVPVYRRRGNLLPLTYLNQVLEVGVEAEADVDAINIVVLQAEDKQFGLIVDEINDTQEIVVKPLGSILRNIRGYAGATIMGDGKIALILDVAGIARLSGVINDTATVTRSEQVISIDDRADDRQALLLFHAGQYERMAVPLSLVARLEEFPASRIERAAGGLVVQYRDQILPLTHLAARLGPDPVAPIPDPFTVTVFADGNRRAGVIVDGIIDILEDTLSIRSASSHECLLGSAVAGGKVTDLLDIHAVTSLLERTGGPGPASAILLTDASSFSRVLMRTYLESAGHRVIEAASCEEALAKLEVESVLAIVAALDLPDPGAATLLGSVRKGAKSQTPVIALNPRADLNGGRGFSDCVFRYDREGLLRSLERLA